jgi:hypothetical protein
VVKRKQSSALIDISVKIGLWFNIHDLPEAALGKNKKAEILLSNLKILHTSLKTT